MELEIILRWVHVIGATVILGTGAGIAFFMLMAHRTKDVAIIAHTAGIVVVADYLFTLSAVILQPVTGVWLALELGWPLNEGWIVLSVILYVVIGCFWLPVVWMQTQMRNMARACVRTGDPLPDRYHFLFRTWFLFGIPAFFSVLTILWLMLARPVLGLF